MIRSPLHALAMLVLLLSAAAAHAHLVFLERPLGDDRLYNPFETIPVRAGFGGALDPVVLIRDPDCLANISISTSDPALTFSPPAPASPVANFTFTVRFTTTIRRTETLTITWVGTGLNTSGQPDPINCGTNTETNLLTFQYLPAVISAGANDYDLDYEDPIRTLSGEYHHAEPPDLYLDGPLPLWFGRYYGAALLVDGNIQGRLGDNWLHNFDWRLLDYGTAVEIVDPRGRVIHFLRGAFDNYYLQDSGDLPFQLRQSGFNRIFFDPRDRRDYSFDAAGSLVQIDDGRGSTLDLAYNAQGGLDQVSDGLGRALIFGYDAAGLLDSVSDGTRSVAFTHAGNELDSATDARGNTTTYTYTASGGLNALLAARHRPAGNTPFSRTFDTGGRVTDQTDAFGNSHGLSYLAGTTTMTDPLGGISAHDYAAAGTLSGMQDALGNSASISSNGTRQRTAVIDRLGATTAYSYDGASGRLAAIDHADGNRTAYSYTPRSAGGATYHDRTGTQFPDGSSEQFSYDAVGNLVRYTDRAGNDWQYSRNTRGQVLTATNPAGGTETFGYDARGNLTQYTDAAGNPTGYLYDNFSRLTRINYADGTDRQFTYDGNSNLRSVTDGRGNTALLDYDSNDRLNRLTDPLGNSWTFAYDDLDRLTALTRPSADTATRSFDALGRLAQVTGGAGDTVTYTYDAASRLIAHGDGAGQTWSRSVDAEGLPTGRTNPLGNGEQYTEDAMGRPTSHTSALGHTTTFSYDAMGRLVGETNPLGHTATLTRDARGLIDSVTLPGGVSAGYTRNALGNITGITDPGANHWQRDHDALGRLTSRTDPLGRTVSYTYDSRNRVDQVTFPAAMGTLTRSYDAAGNLSRALYSDGTDLSFTYDALNRVTGAAGIGYAYDSAGNLTDSNGIGITYDAAGRIASLTLAPGRTVTYGYDGRGLPVSVQDWTGGTTGLVYDSAGRLVSVSRPNGVDTTYSYDADDRLTGIQHGALASTTLSRDANGNVSGAARTGPLTAGVTSGRSISRGVDAAGQLIGVTYDGLGRPIDDGTRSYSWDLGSRLRDYTEAGQTVTHTYDALGRRVTRSAGGVTRSYVWNDATTLPSISVLRDAGGDVRYFVYTPDGLLLYSLEASNGSRRDYHFDEAGNTRFLSDAAATVVAAYSYTPYGERLASTGSVANPFTWGGQWGACDEGNGLYYLRARWYDSVSGRFLSTEPLQSAEPLSLNPYLYARANPLSYADPSGLLTEAFGGYYRLRDNSADVLQEGDDLAAVAAARGRHRGGAQVYGLIELSLDDLPREEEPAEPPSTYRPLAFKLSPEFATALRRYDETRDTRREDRLLQADSDSGGFWQPLETIGPNTFNMFGTIQLKPTFGLRVREALQLRKNGPGPARIVSRKQLHSPAQLESLLGILTRRQDTRHVLPRHKSVHKRYIKQLLRKLPRPRRAPRDNARGNRNNSENVSILDEVTPSLVIP